MRFVKNFVLSLICLTSMGVAQADQILGVEASLFVGPAQTKPGYSPGQGSYQPYDTTSNLAYQGNGFAKPAVAKDRIGGYDAIHQEEFANDGFYGNGASWIGDSANSWLKIDLGRLALFDGVVFGRDRLGGFGDRSPGRILIDVALFDDVYADGQDGNDGVEYARVFDSDLAGYNGAISGGQSLKAVFSTPISARFVKLTFSSGGAAIDEIEIRAAAASVPEPSALASAAVGACAAILGVARRRRKTSDRRESDQTD